MTYFTTKVPEGQKITIKDGKLNVPDRPIIPFVEGDGTGSDIWGAAQRILDAAVAKAYGSERHISWMEVYAGQKAYDAFGEWLPSETTRAFTEFLVGIKGPLTTPVGGGIRSLNVTLRQKLDLYVWGHGMVRPVPELIWGSGRYWREQAHGSVAFATCDVSGLRLFEEAAFWGIRAAEHCLNVLGVNFQTSLSGLVGRDI